MITFRGKPATQHNTNKKPGAIEVRHILRHSHGYLLGPLIDLLQSAGESLRIAGNASARSIRFVLAGAGDGELNQSSGKRGHDDHRQGGQGAAAAVVVTPAAAKTAEQFTPVRQAGDERDGTGNRGHDGAD